MSAEAEASQEQLNRLAKVRIETFAEEAAEALISAKAAWKSDDWSGCADLLNHVAAAATMAAVGARLLVAVEAKP